MQGFEEKLNKHFNSFTRVILSFESSQSMNWVEWRFFLLLSGAERSKEISYVHFLWRKEKNEKKLYSLTFSGAEKEAKRHPPPTKPPPIWGVLSEKSQHAVDFSGFLVSRDTRWYFNGSRTLHYSRPLSRDSKGISGHAMGCLSAGAWRMDRNV